MFIGYYKGVKTSMEFYSEKRKDLNFPTQVVFDGERFLLNKTIQVGSKSQYEKIVETAKGYGIKYDIKID